MIFRVKKDQLNPYVMVNKQVIHDKRLSLKAKAILVYLLSRPDDWKVYETEIVKHARDGRDSVRAGIKELLKHGYLLRCQDRNESGRFCGYEYEVYEYPIKSATPTVDGKSDIGESNTTNNNKTKRQEFDYESYVYAEQELINEQMFYYNKQLVEDEIQRKTANK